MKIELENGAKIAPYVKKESLKQDRGGTTWRRRFVIKGNRKVFSADPNESKDEAYITINRKIHTAINGDKIESKRSTAPTVAEVVAAYLGAKPSSIDADHDTRKNNVSALRIVTRGVVSGSEPVIVKNKDGSYELTEPGFWSNLRLGKLTKKVGKDFLDQRVEGYKKGTTSFDERGRGANDVLRHARGVFTQKAINEVYVEQFKQSDLEALEDKKTGFLKVPFLKVRKPKWKALPQSVVDQILAKVPALETEDPDLYATFLLEFGCGLSWGEVLHAQYSWLDESPQPFENDETRYVINVQPTDGWVPKCQDRERSSTVPANIFQKLLDLRLAPRAPREDRKSGVTVSDEELARLVWSEPAVAVGKRFGVTSTTIKNHCERRGIPTPESGFWTKVQRGTVEHPHGELPEKERIRFQLRTKQTPAPKNDYILQRHRCEGFTGANRRLARWFRANIKGWDRKQVGHELRKLNISTVVCETGSLYEASKHAGHSSIKVTESTYADILKHKPISLPFPNT